MSESEDPHRDELESWAQIRRPELVRMANSILHDYEEAEDIVQETFLAILRQGPRVRRVGAYVSRAVYWNAVKRRARRRDEPSLEAVTAREPITPSSASEPDRLAPFELELAIAGLPPAQQTVIRLRFYLGLTFAEIGRNLSISMNTAASRSRYALEALRRRLRMLEPRKESDHE